MVNWGGKTPPSAQSGWENKEGRQDQSENLTDTVEEILGESEAEGRKSSGNQDVSLEERVLTLQAALEQSKNQADEYYAHLQRLQADFDNYRKRTVKEKDDYLKYASERVVEGLLPVLDNFERALLASKTNQDFMSFAQGVDMIFKQMQTTLAKEGLAAIEAVGQPFDPNMHEAVLQVESDEYPENTVVEELQKGYYLKEKVIRPSMVKVSC
ncbi:molecular chaperone GrpE (heat shock protein) [Desulfitobacterium dichloroeliminans LMG P-21439]|uniref:Protein GrpE n=1 Tax=Desulfitobacterium dichloroeliminans (strain LMG P-21439 / DCA1) TaxID=871963 RepID=L0FBU6_DESDL|nr:nucleotide exchange factor GrpE [Desulfitobacterium dichloroeliminans]AGA70418.1 molecular chaperone GrpE (heat shock protein) [Desulfitobacterium dichloroeliminans LMG P-21439]